ncbi:TMEM179 family protein [Megaselia abdita]
MVLANFLMLSQIAGHVILAILSLLVIIPMTMNLHEFNHNCILFATGTWRESDGLFEVRWPSTGFCNFPIFTGIFVFIISVLQIYKFGRLAHRNEEGGFLGLFIDVVFGIFMTMFAIISAIIVTLGFIVWCSDMTERFPSCDMAAGQNITDKSQNLDTSGFYFEMGTSQFGAWGCFAISVGVAVIALLKLINNHQIRNIKVSMYLERQRLVNEDANVIHPDGRSTPSFPEL